MDFSWGEDEIALRADLRSYIDDNLMPGWTHFDRDLPTAETLAAAVAFCRGLAERGLLVPGWPKEYGGREISSWAKVVISEELRGIGEPRGPQYANTSWLGPALMNLGTDEQRAELLTAIAAGEAMWCQGFSEPDAGSDLSALRTAAERDGDVYIVNGQKIWTSYAHTANYCFLLVRTSKGENQRHGITILLVPMNLDGIEVREIGVLGIHHMLHEVFFNDVRVPVSCRLGPENEGWNIIRTLLANERSQTATYEQVDRGLDLLVEEARRAGVDTDSDRFLERVGSAAAATAADRVLKYAAIQASNDKSPEYSNLAAVSKAAAALMEAKASAAFIDVLGPTALLEDSRGDYQLVSAIETGIGGGSLEMQLNNIAWYVLKLPKG